ncbi:hypothetical protein C7N83_06180 [Neisseria iguanae]|uniref:Uncharacterized protein n=1 Tax=Neisseria iguanae TaxID=90242 RepID=A0A2P7U0L1_9NEIS|nr:hypothetical protein C7N83_06180 [Neisseria iguanae]
MLGLLKSNQYCVGAPCRTVCTVCGRLPCLIPNRINYILADNVKVNAVVVLPAKLLYSGF